jgi:hypothetical protein
LEILTFYTFFFLLLLHFNFSLLGLKKICGRRKKLGGGVCDGQGKLGLKST